MLYAKIVNGELEFTDSTKVVDIDGILYRIDKTAEDLQGYKAVEYLDYIAPSVYENSIESYVETDTTIQVVYSVEKKPTDEIVAFNTEFWNSNYFQVVSLMPTILYAPYTSYLNGEPHNLLKDDYAVLLMGASAGQLTHLELYSQPDFTQEFTASYIGDLKVLISDTSQMTAILGYFGTLNYGARTVPTVM